MHQTVSLRVGHVSRAIFCPQNLFGCLQICAKISTVTRQCSHKVEMPLQTYNINTNLRSLSEQYIQYGPNWTIPKTVYTGTV